MNVTVTDTYQQVAARTVSEWVRWVGVHTSTTSSYQRKLADSRLDGAFEIAYLVLGFHTPTAVRFAMLNAQRELGSRPKVIPTTPATSHRARAWDAQVTEFLLQASGVRS